MDWIDKMNHAVEYIETNLDTSIDFEEVAKIAYCSMSHFQRLFSFIADIPLSEYIRNRRMTIAGYELKNSDIKILDVALKYGYDSPEAFSRAYQNFHGISPSSSRKPEVNLKIYPRISFQINVKGRGMFLGSEPLVRIEEYNHARVASFHAKGKDPEKKAFDELRNWAIKNLSDYAVRRCIGFAPKGHHPNGDDDDEHEYVAQMLLFADEGKEDRYLGANVEDAPKGLFIISDVPMDIVKTNGQPNIGESLKRTSKIMYECLQNMGGYELDFNERNFIEEHVFSIEWFNGVGEKNDFKLWLPIKKL